MVLSLKCSGRHPATVLFACDGNEQEAAKILGISRSSLYRILNEGTYSKPASRPERLASPPSQDVANSITTT